MAVVSILLSAYVCGGQSTTAASLPSSAPPVSSSVSTAAPPTSPPFSLADCPNPISSTTDCDCSQCVLYGSLFLRDKCCSRKGVPATILAFEQSDAWVPRINEFNACTGARLSLTYNGPDGLVR